MIEVKVRYMTRKLAQNAFNLVYTVPHSHSFLQKNLSSTDSYIMTALATRQVHETVVCFHYDSLIQQNTQGLL